jgi:DNA-binding XRE family transcriptional regulator
MANRRRSKDELKEIDALLERLREFIRLNYMTAAEVARQIGVSSESLYLWLQGKTKPIFQFQHGGNISLYLCRIEKEPTALSNVAEFGRLDS